MAGKPILKSVRLSELAFEIVNSRPENGFNNKFEAMVFEFSFTEKERLKRVAELDEEIAIKTEQLRKLNRKLDQGTDLLQKFESINRLLMSANDLAEEFVSQ